MMFATEPVIVRLPASVEAMASASQPACGSGKDGTSVRSSITAGTLLTAFDSRAGDGDEHGETVQVPGGHGPKQVGRRAPPVPRRDDDEQSQEEDEQSPVDFVVDLAGIDGARDRAAAPRRRGHHRGRYADQKPSEHDDQHHDGLLADSARAGIPGPRSASRTATRSLGPLRYSQYISAQFRNRPRSATGPRCADEIEIGDAGQRADEHVLRVARDGRDAADVRRRRHRHQVRAPAATEAAAPCAHERRHHQTDDVVDEKCGQKPAREDNRRQQVMRLQPFDDPFRDPLEEAYQAQVADDQHHREQQHDGGEVNRLERFAGLRRCGTPPSDGTDDGGPGRSIFIQGNLPSAKTK